MTKLVHLIVVSGLASGLAGCATSQPTVELSPRQRAEAQAELGLSRLRKGDIAGARRAYNTASALDPFFVRAHLGLARCHYTKGDLDLEVAEYRKALALSPKLLLVWANLGHALCAMDRLEEARAAYLEVVRLGRSDLIAVQLATVERDLGLPELERPLDRLVRLGLFAEPEADQDLPELREPAEVR